MSGFFICWKLEVGRWKPKVKSQKSKELINKHFAIINILDPRPRIKFDIKKISPYIPSQ